MQNPYSRYQNNQESNPVSKPKKKKASPSRPIKRNRARRNAKKKKEPLFSIPWLIASLGGLVLSFYVFTYSDEVMDYMDKVEFGISTSDAADGEKDSQSSGKNEPKSTPLPVGKVSKPSSGADHLTMKNTNIYKALRDKRRELEKKERRLAQLEEELQLQKVEIEKQLKEMQEMRTNISSKLDRKVAADQESVDKLVGVYSNMKPQNAAIILSSVNDDLAVQVLGKMKKQNAAAILDYVAPAKAQFLSEKFTGLKK